jgi:hypothetical protein
MAALLAVDRSQRTLMAADSWKTDAALRSSRQSRLISGPLAKSPWSSSSCSAWDRGFTLVALTILGLCGF